MGSLLLSPGSWYTNGFVYALQESCFPSSVKLYNQIPLAFKVKFPGCSQIANIHQIIEKKQENSRKNIYLLFIDYAEDFDYAKDFDCVKSVLRITKICGKFLKRCEYQTILSAFWETCTQVKK